jgi:hypothetical protein
MCSFVLHSVVVLKARGKSIFPLLSVNIQTLMLASGPQCHTIIH